MVGVAYKLPWTSSICFKNAALQLVTLIAVFRKVAWIAATTWSPYGDVGLVRAATLPAR